MVEIKLPRYKNNQFMSLIPEQQQEIGELIVKGTILVFSLNDDRTKAWMIIESGSEEEVQETVEQFCLYKYMRIKIQPLTVFDGAMFQLPPLVMN